VCGVCSFERDGNKLSRRFFFLTGCCFPTYTWYFSFVNMLLSFLSFSFSKTTFAQAVFRELGGATNVVYLSHDHYYKDISHKTLEERSQTNFDHPDSLDTELLVQHIRDLKQGQVANLPTYDFATHSRTPVTTLVHPKKIVLVEGILIFTNPELCHECDIKVFVVSVL
jgi:uridine kinase